MSEKIIVGLNDKTKELKGAELEAFENSRLEMQEAKRLFEAEQQAKEEARKSAMSKLKALGLTDDEIIALVP